MSDLRLKATHIEFIIADFSKNFKRLILLRTVENPAKTQRRTSPKGNAPLRCHTLNLSGRIAN